MGRQVKDNRVDSNHWLQGQQEAVYSYGHSLATWLGSQYLQGGPDKVAGECIYLVVYQRRSFYVRIPAFLTSASTLFE